MPDEHEQHVDSLSLQKNIEETMENFLEFRSQFKQF